MRPFTVPSGFAGGAPSLRARRYSAKTMNNTVLDSNDCFAEGRGFAPAGASAASIVAAKGRSFRLTRSAFSLSPLATKASLPKGLSDHCRSAFDFRLRRTRHWRAVALWKPSGPPRCCYTFNAAQYYFISFLFQTIIRMRCEGLQRATARQWRVRRRRKSKAKRQ